MKNSAETANGLLEAITTRDFDGIEPLLSLGVRFRYLVPSGPGEAQGPSEVAARFREWFGDVDALEVLDARAEELADRAAVRYRLRFREEGEWEVVEQQTFVNVDAEGRIDAIDLLCSGFRPLSERGDVTGPGTHRFDAGSLGCADGLAQEFRRRISAIPLGEQMVIETTDPAARADLPPLARMMGHTVRSIDSPGDGRLVITVERGR